MQPASEPLQRTSGRLHRARALYRNVSKRRTAWLLLKDTVNSCIEYRILGLAAEAAFFTLLSVPPLLLMLRGGGNVLMIPIGLLCLSVPVTYLRTNPDLEPVD